MVLVVGQALINLGPAQIGKTRLYLLEVGTEQEVGNDVMDADPRVLDASMTAAPPWAESITPVCTAAKAPTANVTVLATKYPSDVPTAAPRTVFENRA